MTDKELERLERIAVQILGGILAHSCGSQKELANETIKTAQELIKQLDALKIPE